ncbi:hypothetical protein ACFW4M_10155 [Streptomyces sp. NPDC058794]|uniref:hypothetical protein n=1 Tax=unclassified Streptomyces TaxID=2593676 RepID=UPI00369D80A9
MKPELLDKVNRVRESALARGAPPDEVERWLEAARPDATTLPLPPDGVLRLLARSADDGFDAAGEAVYVPAEHAHAAELRDAWRSVRDPDRSLGRPLLRIDGYAPGPYGEFDMLHAAASLRAQREGRPPGEPAGPRALPQPEDWALLAQWYGGVHVHGDVYWTVKRRDLAERRFEAVDVLGYIEGPA